MQPLAGLAAPPPPGMPHQAQPQLCSGPPMEVGAAWWRAREERRENGRDPVLTTSAGWYSSTGTNDVTLPPCRPASSGETWQRMNLR